MKLCDLTAAEQTNVRTALKFLRTRCGEWAAVGAVLNLNVKNLGHVVAGRRVVSARIAFGVARLAKVPVDDVLSGRFPADGTCPYCGHYEAPVAKGEVTE